MRARQLAVELLVQRAVDGLPEVAAALPDLREGLGRGEGPGGCGGEAGGDGGGQGGVEGVEAVDGAGDAVEADALEADLADELCGLDGVAGIRVVVAGGGCDVVEDGEGVGGVEGECGGCLFSY